LHADKMRATDDLRRIHDGLVDGEVREVEGDVRQTSEETYSFEVVKSFPLKSKMTYSAPKKKK